MDVTTTLAPLPRVAVDESVAERAQTLVHQERRRGKHWPCLWVSMGNHKGGRLLRGFTIWDNPPRALNGNNSSGWWIYVVYTMSM